ncbi:hypothetical protein [Haloferula sp.]|uniref:hypothetical protein n=1 Tax=Haloferula sp. TaxID=2497595 RepID=UPI003C733E6C
MIKIRFLAALLSIVGSLADGQISSSVMYVTRSEQCPGVESLSVRISVSMSVDSLTFGEKSYSVFATPSGKTVPGSVGTPRRGNISIAATVEIPDLDALAGSWSIVINGGQEDHENLTYHVPPISTEYFAAYPPFPEFGGLDGSEVVLRHTSNSSSAGSSSEGLLSTPPETGKFVYTFPVGGPYYVYSSQNSDLPNVQIKDSKDRDLGFVRFGEIRSERRVNFFVDPSPIQFGATAEIQEGSVEVLLKGTEPGRTYRILSSEDLGIWENVYSFEARANAHLFRMPIEGDKKFVVFEEVELAPDRDLARPFGQ